MCDCVDVEMGSYDNQIILGYYPVMREYQKNRIKAGLPGTGICVDRCLVEEIISIWKAGIRTYGNCCGHNIPESPPWIAVDAEDFDKAISLGYEKYEYKNDPDRCDAIVPKSIT